VQATTAKAVDPFSSGPVDPGCAHRRSRAGEHGSRDITLAGLQRAACSADGVLVELPAAEVAAAPPHARLGERATLALFGTAIFTGATLVFLIQPMVARMVLPLFGGSQAVWTTSMLFFQAVLLAGYGYAHATTRLLGPSRQPLVHAIVLVLAVAALPIGRGLAPPPADASPSLWLLGVLALAVGAPFFVVTTASPLLQRWLATSGHAAGRDPYFLYAAGNVGSLIALIAYPFLVEPLLTLDQQARLWSLGYVLFAVLSLACLLVARRGGASAQGVARRTTAPSIAWRTRARWVMTALVPSSLMLGVTTYISTDVASFPLLWVLPLAVYLLTFIVSFARRPLVTPRAAARILPLPTALVFADMLGAVTLPLPIALLAQLLVLFFAGALAHGQLAQERPRPERLTEFYFLLSLGGVLGGALNALLAPLVFDSVLEYPLALVLALALRRGSRARLSDLAPVLAVFCACFAGLVVIHSVAGTRAVFAATVVACLTIGARRPLRLTLGFACLALLLSAGSGGLHAERTFFGVLRVTEQDGEHRLYHGTTLHGVERFSGPLAGEPLTYYGRRGPLGDVFAAYSRFNRIDAIGLGVGTLAAYGRPGERLTFYELDPAIARVARNPQYFTYLRDSRAEVAVVLGDGRRMIDRVPNGGSDLVVVDAFSSDSVPVHLLTREAMELYVRKLRPGGLLAFHVTNRHLELAPVLARTAGALGLSMVERDDRARGAGASRTPSRWLVIARSPRRLEPLLARTDWHIPKVPAGRVWTDDYSNVLSVVDWTG
jgi:SAM-dependent methyltransferase